MQEHNLTEYRDFLRVTRLYYICCCWKKIIFEDLNEDLESKVIADIEMNDTKRPTQTQTQITTTRELPQITEMEDNVRSIDTE